jgi:hypothetical protein
MTRMRIQSAAAGLTVLALAGCGSASALPSPANPLPSSAAIPGITAKPSPSRSAAFQPTTLLATVTGSGDDTTAKFTVGGNGDYDVDWTYSQGSYPSSVNFMILEDGSYLNNFNGPNQLGKGGSGTTRVYGDAGTHYLEVLSEGDWTVRVVSAP